MTTQTIARLVTRNVKPVWVHDCTQCRFVGRYRDYDLYVCCTVPILDRDESETTYLARFGDDPASYRSLGNYSARGTIYNLIRILASREVGVTNAYV